MAPVTSLRKSARLTWVAAKAATQSPSRYWSASSTPPSNPGDMVLDPFCGCGTTVHAAQKLGRRWIGIDVTHLAIGLIEKRLRDAFRDQVPPLQFTTHGVPQDLAGARDMAARGRDDKNYYFEFEKWALSLIAAQPGQPVEEGRGQGHRRQPVVRAEARGARDRFRQGGRQCGRGDDPRPARRDRTRRRGDRRVPDAGGAVAPDADRGGRGARSVGATGLDAAGVGAALESTSLGSAGFHSPGLDAARRGDRPAGRYASTAQRDLAPGSRGTTSACEWLA